MNPVAHLAERFPKRGRPSAIPSGFRALFVLLTLATGSLYGQAPRGPAQKSPEQTARPPQQNSLAPLLQQAKDAIEKNDFAAAVEPLQKYLAQHPDDPFTHFQLGYAYSELKRWDDAKAEYARAIALDPKIAQAHLNLGLLLLDSDPAAAAESFRHAAELQPTESRPKFLTGTALERAAKLPEAVAQYRAALALSPNDFEYHFSLARVLLRNGNGADAESNFRAAVSARDDSAPARLGLANALLMQKKYDSAAEALAEYLKLNPSDRSARIDRVNALMEINRFDDALADLDLAESGTAPTAEGLKMRSSIYMQQKDWKAAGDTILKTISSSPDDPELPIWLGHVEIELHEYPTAIKVLGVAVARNPKSPDPLRDLINAYFLSQDYSSTLGAMDRLAQMEPPKAMSWFVRAICYDKLSHKVEAIDSYQKFLDQDNSQNEIQDFQARRRIYTLQSELGNAPKKKNH